MIEVTHDDIYALLGKEYFTRVMLERELERQKAERDEPEGDE
jgi:hypothetical protein